MAKRVQVNSSFFSWSLSGWVTKNVYSPMENYMGNCIMTLINFTDFSLCLSLSLSLLVCFPCEQPLETKDVMMWGSYPSPPSSKIEHWNLIVTPTYNSVSAIFHSKWDTKTTFSHLGYKSFFNHVFSNPDLNFWSIEKASRQ